jgi:hypothetical protein
MLPAIHVIPTFGIYRGCSTKARTINQPMPNILTSWMGRMIRIDRITSRRPRFS